MACAHLPGFQQISSDLRANFTSPNKYSWAKLMAYLKYPLTFLFLNPVRHIMEVEKNYNQSISIRKSSIHLIQMWFIPKAQSFVFLGAALVCRSLVYSPQLQKQ